MVLMVLLLLKLLVLMVPLVLLLLVLMVPLVLHVPPCRTCLSSGLVCTLSREYALLKW
jgi:hypothetical protein